MPINVTSRPRKTTKPSLRSRTLRGQKGGNVVPTVFFAPELERILTKLETELADRSNGQPGQTGIEMLAQRLAAANGNNPERYVRRIYDWRHCLTNAVPADTVDRIYVAVGETHTEPSVPIPELPGNIRAAREMVEVWCPELNAEEAEALATKMLHISQGMCWGWDIIDLEIVNGLELFFGAHRR